MSEELKIAYGIYTPQFGALSRNIFMKWKNCVGISSLISSHLDLPKQIIDILCKKNKKWHQAIEFTLGQTTSLITIIAITSPNDNFSRKEGTRIIKQRFELYKKVMETKHAKPITYKSMKQFLKKNYIWIPQYDLNNNFQGWTQ